MSGSGDGPGEVHRISGAPPPHSADLDRRVSRYLLSMAVRTGCLLLVFVVPGPARWGCAAGAVALPYVAVILANAGRAGRGPGASPARTDDPAQHPDAPPPDSASRPRQNPPATDPPVSQRAPGGPGFA
jgi:hypothetical protein